MENAKCRYMVNALGKDGETYITSCHSKKEIKEWVEKNKHKICNEKIIITDRNKAPDRKLFVVAFATISILVIGAFATLY